MLVAATDLSLQEVRREGLQIRQFGEVAPAAGPRGGEEGAEPRRQRKRCAEEGGPRGSCIQILVFQ